MDGGGVTIADQNIGTRAFFQHIGEILAAHDQGRIITGPGNGPGDFGGKFRLRCGIHHRRIAAHVVDGCDRAIGQCCGVDQGFQTGFGQFTHLAAHRADRAFQQHPLRDHVERGRGGLKRCHRHHDLRHRVGIAADDALQGKDNVTGDQRAVDHVLRLGGMATLAFDLDGKLIRGGKERTGPYGKRSNGTTGPIVHAVDFVNLPAVHHAIGAHLAATAAALFGGLKNDHHGAVEIAGFGQIFGRAQQHRGMAIMATGMHRAGGFAGIVQAGLFHDRQCVHIGAQPDHLATIRAAPDHANHAGAANAGHHLVTAKRAQLFGHHCRCAMGVEQYFRMRVQVAPPGGNLGQHFGKAVLDRHVMTLRGWCKSDPRALPRQGWPRAHAGDVTAAAHVTQTGTCRKKLS